MGCSGSKLDELQAVALCRDRSQYLAEAIRHRDAFAEAHASYVLSLRSVGVSLQRFFLLSGEQDGISSPVLTLPSPRKGDPFPKFDLSPPMYAHAVGADSGRHSLSNSGSHIHFVDDDGDDSGEDDLRSDLSSPFHDEDFSAFAPEVTNATAVTTTYYNNYAKKAPPAPAVTYEQTPFNPNVVQDGTFDGDSDSFYNGHSYSNQNLGFYNANNGGYPNGGNPFPYQYQNHPAYGGVGGGFYGSFSQALPVAAPISDAASTSSSRPPPAPPSPPKTSTWDFLNPFQTLENPYRPYTPSWNSMEVREAEGIPELEDIGKEVVKEAYGDKKFLAASSGPKSKGGNKTVKVEKARKKKGVRELKNVVSNEAPSKRMPGEGEQKKLALEISSMGPIVREISTQFERASSSCDEVSKFLEVGEHPHRLRKNEVISSRMMYAVAPSHAMVTFSQPSTSKNREKCRSDRFTFLEMDEEKGLKAGGLSTTLQKLYIWEKKLHEEVRAEEKMRMLYVKKCKQLKLLVEKGAEAPRVDATQDLIKKLSTKIRVALQVISSISKRLNKLRNEELHPQIDELIHGLFRMWQEMRESHRSQFQTILSAKSLDAIASSHAEELSEFHMEATIQMELDILSWIETFSRWIDSQKKCVSALNNWLLKCVHYELEETADGVAPFSPGRIGAPPVFVICNKWSQAIDRISEVEIIVAMQAFAQSVLGIWQQHFTERRRRMAENQDMDRMLKALEKEDHKIHRAVNAVNRRCVQMSNKKDFAYPEMIIHSGHIVESKSLQFGLKQIFETLERFTDNQMKAYKQICRRCDKRKAEKEVTKLC